LKTPLVIVELQVQQRIVELYYSIILSNTIKKSIL